jgi:hypothetical protein
MNSSLEATRDLEKLNALNSDSKPKIPLLTDVRLVSAWGRRLACGARPDADGRGGIGVHMRFLRVQAATVHWVGHPGP